MKGRPKIVLFDVVGTLLHPTPSVSEAYARWGAEFGSQRGAKEISARFPAAFGRVAAAGGPGRFDRLPTSEEGEWERWRQIVTEIFDDIPDAAAGGLFFSLWEHFARSENWSVYDDVFPAIAKLTDAGFALGAASNFDRRLGPILRAHRPLRKLEPVFVSSEVGFPKPSPRFFEAVEATLGLRGEEVLLVGDDVENDYHGALAFGWQAILLDRHSRHGGLLTIASLEELPKILTSGT